MPLAVHRKFLVLLLLAVATAAFASLLMGAPFLQWALPGGLPAGNLVAACALCALPAAALALRPRSAPCRWLAWATGALALLWLPASVLLAGNLALNFSGDRGAAWLLGTLCLAVAGLVVLAWSLFVALWPRR